jgi:hypothetical protein
MSGAGYECANRELRARNDAHHPQQRDRNGFTGHVRGNTPPAQRHQRGEQPATVLRSISTTNPSQFACQLFSQFPQLDRHRNSSQFIRGKLRRLWCASVNALAMMCKQAADMREFCAVTERT